MAIYFNRIFALLRSFRLASIDANYACAVYFLYYMEQL